MSMTAFHERHISRENTIIVSDVDRFLVNTPLAQDRYLHAVERVAGIDPIVVFDAYEENRHKAGSFDTLGFVRGLVNNEEKMQDIEWAFLDDARSSKDNFLLEDGALEYIQAIEEAGLQHFLMTYGVHDWQRLKLIASGLNVIPYRVVNTKHKARKLAEFYDSASGRYDIPVHNTHFTGTDIFIGDDKASTFTGAADSIWGMHVTPHSGEVLLSQIGTLPHDGILAVRGLRRGLRELQGRLALAA